MCSDQQRSAMAQTPVASIFLHILSYILVVTTTDAPSIFHDLTPV